LANSNWFRNEDWNPNIEADFRQRLARARNKAQYLRIQASHLAERHPRVTLDLIAEYFAHEPNGVDMAQAHVDRAKAYLALGNVGNAISSYEDALKREQEFPNWKTQAYVDFSCLVANARVISLYTRALEVLDERGKPSLFPVERYRTDGSRALLLQELGRPEEAKLAAERAMAAASQIHSGLRHHPDLGLVKDTSDEFGKRVAALADASERAS
jgi:tetratricopeptide (TPR) repeat protein